MKCFVTGASGFIGANLVHELTARGHHVRCLLRPGANTLGLSGVRFEAVTGDITNKSDELAKLMDGCDWVFHVAASYHLWLREYGPMYKANVLGTQKIIRAATRAGIQRIVYTSTVGCIALPRPDATGTYIPTDESVRVSETQMSNHYKRSKWQAEVAAREAALNGVPIVIVNPSFPIGPRDVRPTPSGQFLMNFLNRKMPAYLDSGLNWVHVQDVAIGHILAAEKGRIGERYILGNAHGNWTMEKALNVLSNITGIPAPQRKLPYELALMAAHFDELWSRFTNRHPRIPVAGVRMARHKMWFNPEKAIVELGLPQTPPEQAIHDAIKWFQDNGYTPKTDPQASNANAG